MIENDSHAFYCCRNMHLMLYYLLISSSRQAPRKQARKEEERRSNYNIYMAIDSEAEVYMGTCLSNI